MFSQVFGGLTSVLLVPEVYLGAPFAGVMLLWSVRFLARGYSGTQTLFDSVLTANVLSGVTIFVSYAGPGMLLGSNRHEWLNFCQRVFSGTVTVWPGLAIAAGGFAVALLVRSLLPLTRVWSCYGLGLFVIAGVAYLATDGRGHVIPTLAAAAALGVAGVLVVLLSQSILALFVDRLQAAGFLSALRRYEVQASVLTTPLVTALAISPYASWLRAANGF
jgi:hypothetical protein